MAASVPETEPTTLVAGDTWSWQKTLANYSPSDGWSLSYALRLENGAGLINVTGASSSTGFTITIPAASTNTQKAGTWQWASYVTKGADRYSVGFGHLEVLPNLSAIDYTADLRSPARRAYDNALVAWEGVKLGQTVELNGRRYSQHNLEQLIKYVNQCKTDYAQELQAEQMAQTGINTKRIGIRLVRI